MGADLANDFTTGYVSFALKQCRIWGKKHKSDTEQILHPAVARH